jgi:uncharacterized membrane protein
VSDRAPSGLSRGLSWVVLALLGLPGSGVAAYLTYSHWADQPTVCGGIGECELVQTSKYSDIAGVPVALLGLLYFVAMSLLALARVSRISWIPDEMRWAQPLALSMALAATAFVAYLTYIELFVLEAICIWCVSLASLTVISLVVTVWALLSTAEE